jgi:VIT1/CCC1 family predicted Fe2+/Mn2+ transporter
MAPSASISDLALTESVQSSSSRHAPRSRRASGANLVLDIPPNPDPKTCLVLRDNDTMPRRQRELHRSGRTGWLRAAVLGADDGIVSTASLMIGVAASAAAGAAVLVAGLAGLVAGAMSMAVGEYVSVSSQRDAEEADIRLESAELARDPSRELGELTELYVRRGLEPDLARTVAERLSTVNPLGTHLREELGLGPAAMARPVQAALVSALSFAAGAGLPLLIAIVTPTSGRIATIALAALVSLAVLGIVGGRLGGASAGRAALRVMAGGAVAMAVTAVIGRLVGALGL